MNVRLLVSTYLVVLGLLPVCASGSATFPKTSTELYVALSTGAPQEVLVILNDAEIQEGLQARQPQDRPLPDTRDRRRLKVEGYADLKGQLFADVAAPEIFRDFPQLPMALVQVRDLSEWTKLEHSRYVKQLLPNQVHRLFLAESLPLINQLGSASSGHLGSGTTVAVLDTGVDYRLEAFGSCTAPGVPSSCKVVFAADFTNSDDGSLDAHGHGSNVAGIVLGVSPDARIAALDVFSGEYAYSSDIIAAIDWAISQQDRYNIVAINLSLGAAARDALCSDSWATRPFAEALAVGITPVVASGNDGYVNAISDPACAPGALSVGAVYDSNVGSNVGWSTCTDATTRADLVTCFSNSAPFLTLLAPGAVIDAAGLTSSGTSMAAPHVAGALSVVRGDSAFPFDTPADALGRLTDSGVAVTDPRNGLAHPRIDLEAALSGVVVASPPVVTAFAPSSAGEGEQVRISGRSFADVQTVRFGGIPAFGFESVTPTQLLATVGPGASGAVSVTTAEGSDSLGGFNHLGTTLTGLSAQPNFLSFESLSESRSVSVTAHYSGGTSRDVTDSSILISSDQSVAVVESGGIVRPMGDGQTTIEITNGLYRFSVPVEVAGAAIGDREREPNGTLTDANPISLVDHRFYGALADSRDIDLFRFDVQRAGEVILLIRPVDDRFDGGVVRASILNSLGEPLVARSFVTHSTTDTTLAALVADVDRFYLQIERDANFRVSTKDYVVTTRFNPDLTLFNYRELEPNSTFLLATAVPEGNDMLGQLYDSSDVDTFAIMVSRPSDVTVCGMAVQRSDDGRRVRLAIFDGVGTLLAARSVRGGVLEATCITARAIDVGAYYVVVDGYPDFPTFDSDYRLTFAFYDDFGSLHQREVEPNEDQVSATPATIGAAPIVGQMSSEDDADFYAIDVGGGGEIELRLLPGSQSFDGGAITVSVLDPNGQVISEGRVPGSARLPLVLTAAPRGPGAHFIRVSGADRDHVFEQDYLIETRWLDRAPGFDLTIDIEGRGNGTVEIEPGGIRCTERCTETFAPGTVVTLSGVAEDGSTFGGWGGGCHDIGSTCVLAMAEDRSVAASFQLGTVSECGSNIHRFWNPTTQAHFYTISEAETDFVIRNLPEWRYEGFAWNSYADSSDGGSPVYRFWSDSLMSHFFTISEYEKELVETMPAWRFEGIAWYAHASPTANTLPVYRFWSDEYRTHFFTIDEGEKAVLRGQPAWRLEGVAWYSLPTSACVMR